MKWVNEVALKRAAGRDLSRSAVLNLLGTQGPISRADIARTLGLSPAAVTQITRRLLDQGLAQHVAQAKSNGGRPGELIGLVGSSGRALGVKLAADHLTIVNVRLDGQMLSSESVPFDPTRPGALHLLGNLLSERVATQDDSLPPLLGVGVAAPGTVRDPEEGVLDADVLRWTDVPVGRHLRGVLGLPVVVENDVNALAVAEVLYGHGRETRDFLVLTIGRGVGLSIVSDGAVYRGGAGGAGEFGHFPIEPDGPECACGRHGCLEARVGEQGLIRWARERGVLGPRQTFRALVGAADAGRGEALDLFAEAGRLLGRAVAGVANLLDPDQIVVLGEGTAHWRHWDAGFREEFDARRLHRLQPISVHVDSWDDNSWAQGAAALVLAAPFDAEGLGGAQTDLVLARLNRAAGDRVG